MKVKKIIEIEDNYEGMSLEEALHDLTDCVFPVVGGKSVAFVIEILRALEQSTPYNPTGDCISREYVKAKMFDIPKPKEGATFWDGVDTVGDLIDNAPVVNTNVVADNVIKAHENIGYEQGFNDGYAECVTDNERPQGDCISREALRNIMKCNLCSWGAQGVLVDEVMRTIDNAPPVEVFTLEDMQNNYDAGVDSVIGKYDKAKGEWIDHFNDGYVECPFCGSATTCDENKDELHFCFNCGADMRAKENKNV